MQLRCNFLLTNFFLFEAYSHKLNDFLARNENHTYFKWEISLTIGALFLSLFSNGNGGNFHKKLCPYSSKYWPKYDLCILPKKHLTDILKFPLEKLSYQKTF